jgi:serine/threonine protein kinase
MIRGSQYTKVADIWSAGILLFAICEGFLPFDDDNLQQLLHKIIYTEPQFPSFMTPPLVDLLSKMICKDPESRISIEMIKNHPWFSQSEDCTLMQLSQAHTQHWETGEGQSAESAIDAEVITHMTNIGIDCHDLHQALLTQGEDTDTTVRYKIFLRQKLTENMCGLMQKVAAGAAPGVHPIVHFSKTEVSGPSATVVVPGVSPRSTAPGKGVVPIVGASSPHHSQLAGGCPGRL